MRLLFIKRGGQAAALKGLKGSAGKIISPVLLVGRARAPTNGYKVEKWERNREKLFYRLGFWNRLCKNVIDCRH